MEAFLACEKGAMVPGVPSGDRGAGDENETLLALRSRMQCFAKRLIRSSQIKGCRSFSERVHNYIA